MNTLYLGLANFSLCKGFRVGSGNIGNSAQFVLILQARMYLPPTAPLVCFTPPPPSILQPWKVWQNGHERTDLAQCGVNGSNSVSEKAKHKKIFVSVPTCLNL